MRRKSVLIALSVLATWCAISEQSQAFQYRNRGRLIRANYSAKDCCAVQPRTSRRSYGYAPSIAYGGNYSTAYQTSNGGLSNYPGNPAYSGAQYDNGASFGVTTPGVYSSAAAMTPTIAPVISY